MPRLECEGFERGVVPPREVDYARVLVMNEGLVVSHGIMKKQYKRQTDDGTAHMRVRQRRAIAYARRSALLQNFVHLRTSKIRINVQVPCELGKTPCAGIDTHLFQQILEDYIM